MGIAARKTRSIVPLGFAECQRGVMQYAIIRQCLDISSRARLPHLHNNGASYAMPNLCKEQTCEERLRRKDHYLCRAHWDMSESGDIDECPECGVYKDSATTSALSATKSIVPKVSGEYGPSKDRQSSRSDSSRPKPSPNGPCWAKIRKQDKASCFNGNTRHTERNSSIDSAPIGIHYH